MPEPDFSENSPGADPCDQQSSRSSWIRSATGGETQGAATTAMAMGGVRSGHVTYLAFKSTM